jgi:1A family penicillin-binding protein
MVQRKYYRHIFQRKRKGKLLFRALGGFFIFCFSLFLISALVFIFYARSLPRPEKFTERPFIESSKIYDRSGKIVLYEFYGEERREVVSLSAIPEYLKNAVIAAEDADFYHHFGISFKGIFRSFFVNLKLMKPLQGGSTISQQLIRSSFLSLEKTVKRKVREIVLTLELERRYSKDQILEFYLNQVPFGENSYGAEAASQVYFGKSVSDISIAEAATLAALIQAPSRLSPYGEHKEGLLARKDYILERMAELNFLSKEEAEKAKAESLRFISPAEIKAPHFVMYVREYLINTYGEESLKEKGLKVATTLDWELQELAEKAVKERAKNNEALRAFNASLVAINPKTGEILAMVGSKDFWADPYPLDCRPGQNCLFEPQYNVATGYPGRQPGSAFKPFVYVTAFKKGYSDETIVIDEETNFNGYTPQNYDGLFRGPVTLRQALGQSLNVPSVKALNSFAGIEDSIKTAQNFGITTLNRPFSHYGLSLVLGGGEVRLLDMVSAFGVFATSGYRLPPSSIIKIEDSQGNILEENKDNIPKLVINPEPVNLVNDILSDNEARSPIFGQRSAMYFENYQVAAKTGTTQNYKDGWIIGYTPSLVVGVWVGNNDNSPMYKEPGISVAGPIWRNFIEKALLRYPKEFFPKTS